MALTAKTPAHTARARHLHHQKTHPPTLLFKPNMHTFVLLTCIFALDLYECGRFVSARVVLPGSFAGAAED